MRRVIFWLILLGWVTTASAATTGRGGIFFGQKTLDHADWGDLDAQSAWGIHLDVKDESWPVWATLGYFSSRDEETLITSVSPFSTAQIEGATTEIQVGLKKDFSPLQRVRLSLAGGPAHIRASLSNSVSPFNRDSDSALGYWAGAEAIFFLPYMSLGIAYKFSQADMQLLGRSVNAGGSNVSFSVGFGW